MRAAASRTFWTAGNNKPIKIAMMAITTSNSIRVNPERRRDMVGTLQTGMSLEEYELGALQSKLEGCTVCRTRQAPAAENVVFAAGRAIGERLSEWCAGDGR
jgi:hypothetical protein